MNKLAIKLIECYQKDSTPRIKKCRFIPTCSEYAKECYKKFNFIKASYLTTKRLLKCNPATPMQIDRVPESKNYKFLDLTTLNNHRRKKHNK